MMLLKECTRCGGDMFVENDLDGIDLVCLQCGYRRMEKGYVVKQWLSGAKVRTLLAPKASPAIQVDA